MKNLTKEQVLRLFFWKSDSDYKNISLRITKYLTVFVVIAFFANAFYYGYETHHTIIRADLWRFIELYLMPYYNGTFELKMLWSDHHPNPISAILFILSAEYFDLTVSLYYYVGIISKIFFMAFFLYLMDKSIERKSPLLYLMMMLVVSIFFSLKSHAEYTTSLVTFGNFWMLLSLTVLYIVDKVLKKIQYQILLN